VWTIRAAVAVSLPLVMISVAWLACAESPETEADSKPAQSTTTRRAAATKSGDAKRACVPQPPKPTQSAPEELELLNRIRREVGSPLEASLFQGRSSTTSGEKQSAPSFEAAYSAAAEGMRNDGPETSWAGRILPEGTEGANPLAVYTRALRAAARRLEMAAADLEDAEHYENADQLRERARQLRLDARAARSPENAAP